MSTTISDLVTRAIGFSVANQAPALTASAAEMIARVAAFESDVFQAASRQSRYFYATTTGNSTNAASARTLDLSTVANLMRVHRVTITSTGALVKRVDQDDTDAEFAPRYFLAGTVLTEVGSDWGASGVVGLTIGYVKRQTALSPSGALTQTVTLPDEYTDLLVIRLAHYLAQKDTGREPTETESLWGLYERRLRDVLDSLEHFGGTARRRFIDPAPLPPGSE